MKRMTPTMASLGMGRLPTQSASRNGILDTAMKWPKTMAPAMMNSTMQLVSRPSLPASTKFFQVSFRRASPITIAPAAPIAPAWVGLNHPSISPPIARMKRMTASMMPLVAFSFSRHVLAGPGGPRAGLRAHTITTTATNIRLRMMPGTIPATKSLPIDSSTRMP